MNKITQCALACSCNSPQDFVLVAVMVRMQRAVFFDVVLKMGSCRKLRRNMESEQWLAEAL